MRAICSIVVLYVGASAYAAPPPDASGVFADWFKSLTVPGIPGAPCCTVADCRMVEAIWNDRTRHYEARVMREKFSNALDKPIVSQEDEAAHQTAKSAWMKRWIAKYGDTPDVRSRKPRSILCKILPGTRYCAGQCPTASSTVFTVSCRSPPLSTVVPNRRMRLFECTITSAVTDQGGNPAPPSASSQRVSAHGSQAASSDTLTSGCNRRIRSTARAMRDRSPSSKA